MEHESDLFQHELERLSKRRRDLLPVWIKIFIWIFLLIGITVPIALFYGLNGFNFHISLYGMDSFQPFSKLGLFLLFLFLIKALASYGLWTEKRWAVKLAIADAFLGIATCTFVMLYSVINPQPNFIFSFRLELALLIPYLLRLIKIKEDWEYSAE
jgi:hypothetical protein